MWVFVLHTWCLGVPHEQGFMWGVPAWTTHGLSHVCMYVCMYICIFFKLELLHEGHFGQFTASAAGSVEHQLAVGAACPAGDSEEVDCNALSFVSFRVIGLLHFREAACC